MGNHNSSGKTRKLDESRKLANVESGRVEKKRCTNGTRDRRRRGRCGQMSDNFIIHGIDYLPESIKKKERRKKHVPKFIFFDELLWHGNRLNFLARFQNGHGHGHSNGVSVDHKLPEKEPKTTAPDPSQITLVMTRSKTACAGFSEEKLTDWRTYPDYPFRNIVMSGGGSKGYAYIGSLRALEDCGILKNVSKVAGCSAGAICAGLLAVGCSPQEIADVFKCDIKWLFHDQTCACCCCLPRVCNKFGIHPAKRFHEIYGEHLRRKVGNADITFLELKESMNRELCVVVTNLSRMCSEYFNHKTTPDLPIRDAVRMSMAFPVVFRAVRYTLSGRECLYTDGGLLDQYPIHFFDDDGSDSTLEGDVEHEEENCNDFEGNELPNMATLGLYVVSEKPIDHKIWQALFGKEIPCKPTYLPNTKLARERLGKEMAKRKMHNKKFDKQEFMDELCSSVGDGAKDVLDHYEIWNKSHVDIRNFGEYFIATLETLLISQRKLRIKINDSLRTVAINCGYIGTNDYVIEPGDREFMIDQGYTGTVRYLREFIASRNPSTVQRKKKVPRSRSSNLADQYRVQDELIRELIPKSVHDPCDGRPLASYFLPEDDFDGGNDKPAEENIAPAVPHDLHGQTYPLKDEHKSSDLKYQRNNSSENPDVEVSKDPVGEFFHDSLRYSLHFADLTRTCSSRENVNSSSSVCPSMLLLRDPAYEEETKQPSQSFSSNQCDSRRPPASAILSTSSESEGYEDLVSRTLAALDRLELEPILESKV